MNLNYGSKTRSIQNNIQDIYHAHKNKARFLYAINYVLNGSH